MSVREASTPVEENLSYPASIPAVLVERLRDYPNDVYCERRGASGMFEQITVRDYARDVFTMAQGLIAHGLKPGDRVGLMGNTSYDWVVCDLAIMCAGGVVVPIYQTSSTKQVEWIAENSDLTALIVESEEYANVTAPVVEKLSLDLHVIDRGDVKRLQGAGKETPQDEVDTRIHALQPDDIATIVYTSGTTGNPKGALLSHANFMHHAVNGVENPALGGTVLAGQDSRILMFLPLSHVFGRFIEFVCLYSRCVVGYTPSMKTVVDDLGDFKPTWLLAVPRVFETVFNKARNAGKLQKMIFDWASRVAHAYSVAQDRGGPGLGLKAQHAVADAVVFSKLRKALGGDVEYAICGGAPLGQWLGHFYRGLGIQILEGYGATETAAPTSVNLPGHLKVGTVGTAFPGASLRVVESGEIQIKGPHVFRGYLDNPEATEEAFDDGWYKTGDLGKLDDEGYLTVTGRVKELLVTAGGENVQPAVLEDSLRRHTLISEVVVVGDRERFVGAMITLDGEMLPGWLKTRGLPAMSIEEAGRHPKVREALDVAVKYANENVNRAQSIRKYVVLPRDLEQTKDELSASLKVRRPVVMKNFAREYAALYDK